MSGNIITEVENENGSDNVTLWTFEVGMAIRGGSCGPARGTLVKNVGRTNIFNLLTCISPQHVQASCGAGWPGPLTCKKK